KGVVTNTGNVDLSNVTVVDDRAGTVFTATTLTAHASATFSGSYTPSGNLCGPFTDTVTAGGSDICTGSRVTDTASTTCSVATSPCIDVTKECDGAPFAIGNPIKFKGFVTNCGDVTLTGVVVVDDKAGAVLSATTLAPGASVSYSGSYTPSGSLCGPFTDTVTATGTNACTSQPISKQAS